MMPLGLAQPLGLLALAGLAVLVWIRLREGRQRSLDVPSLMLWGVVREDRERRRFRVDPLFLLQCALVLLLAFALAAPYGETEGSAAPGRRVIFVFDTSASMQTRETDGRRFDLARRRARELLAELRADDESMVIAADVQPRVIAPLSRDHRAIAAAIEGLEPTEGLSRLAFGVQLARSVGVEGVELELAVFTDLPREEVEIPLGPGERLRYVRVGRTDDNVAIAALRVDRNPFEDASAARAYAALRNYSSRSHEVVLHVALDGEEVQADALELAPGESRLVPIRELAGAGVLEARIAVDDALSADDRAFAHVAPDRTIEVVAVTDRAALAEDLAALARAAPALALRVLTPAEADAATIATADVAIFHEWAPPAPLAANALFVHPVADTPWFGVGGEIVDARILDWDEEHALLDDLRYLDAIRLGETRWIRPPEWGRSVIRSQADREEFPLAFAGETDGRRIVCLAFDLADTSLRRSEHLTLLLLVLNSIRWLTPPDPGWPLPLEVGESFHRELDGVSDVTVVGPRGNAESLGTVSTVEVVIDRVGEIRVDAGDETRTLLGNLFDAEESNVGRVGEPGESIEAGTADGAPRAARRLAVDRHDLVPPLLFAVIALLLLEWGIAWRNRREAD